MDVLAAQTTEERIKAEAAAEKLELKILKQEDKKSFMDYVLETDKNYKDTVFWLMEHTKNENLQTISNWTLGWRVEIQQRILKRLSEERRNG